MKVKELKGKRRPDWNPSVKITFGTTKSLVLGIQKAVKTGWWINADEFICAAIRDKLDEIGIKHCIEPPEEEEK